MTNKYSPRGYLGTVRKAALGLVVSAASFLGPCIDVDVNVYVQPGAVTGVEAGAVSLGEGTLNPDSLEGVVQKIKVPINRIFPEK